MGPIVAEVSKSFADKSVKFVEFNFTTDETKKQALADAKALGVEGTYNKNAPKNGFALVYDTKKQKVLRRLSAEQDAAAWSKEITKDLGGV